MKFRSIASEAWRNVLSGASRTQLLLAATLLPFISLALLEVASVSRLEQDATAFRASGAAIIVLDAPGLVDGAACERLTSVAGIEEAGATAQASQELVPIATPQNDIPLHLVTPGFLHVIGAPAEGGIALESSVAAQFGLDRATTLATTAGAIPVAGSYNYPDDGRSPVFQYAALAPVSSSGRFDQCWAEVWPADPAKWPLLYDALASTPPTGVQVSVGQLNSKFGESLQSTDQFHERTSRWAPVAAALLGVATVYFVTRLRRLELSMNRHLGVHRSAVTLQLMVETLLWGSAVCAAGWSAIALFAHSAATGGASSASFGLTVLLSGLAGCLLGAGIGGLSSSERHVFRFFKDRS
jgi:hypothetical protein